MSKPWLLDLFCGAGTERVIECAHDLLDVVAAQDKAQREGYWNTYHRIAVAASSIRLEAALAEEGDRA